MKFEYLVIACDYGGLPTEDGLNELGKDGWELVAIIPAKNSSGRTFSYFKRIVKFVRRAATPST